MRSGIHADALTEAPSSPSRETMFLWGHEFSDPQLQRRICWFVLSLSLPQVRIPWKRLLVGNYLDLAGLPVCGRLSWLLMDEGNKAQPTEGGTIFSRQGCWRVKATGHSKGSGKDTGRAVLNLSRLHFFPLKIKVLFLRNLLPYIF